MKTQGPGLAIAVAVVLATFGCSSHNTKHAATRHPTAAAMLPTSQVNEAALTLGDLPPGWISRPKAAPTLGDGGRLCGMPHPPVEGAFRGVAYSPPKPGIPLVMEAVEVLPTPQEVSGLLDRADQALSCSTFTSHRVRYRLARVLLPVTTQRTVAAVLNFHVRHFYVTEYVVFIKQDNVLLQIEEAGPRRFRDPGILGTTASAAIKRVIYAETHASPVSA